jgi:hypothetical protein
MFNPPRQLMPLSTTNEDLLVTTIYCAVTVALTMGDDTCKTRQTIRPVPSCPDDSTSSGLHNPNLCWTR